jgi:hypothetical protein
VSRNRPNAPRCPSVLDDMMAMTWETIAMRMSGILWGECGYSPRVRVVGSA